MKFEIRTIFGGVAFSTDAETMRDTILKAISAKADLRYADLRSADLQSADLRYADLRYADLQSADLRSADLRSADLQSADLRYADLRSADLQSADLRYADLRSADLQSADLRYADLRYADLRSADLRYADLPFPQMILAATWGSLTEQLTADLMEYDAGSHPDRTAFEQWAAGGLCPYNSVKVQRATNFKEVRELWGKGVVDTPYNLMMRVLKEKTKQE